MKVALMSVPSCYFYIRHISFFDFIHSSCIQFHFIFLFSVADFPFSFMISSYLVCMLDLMPIHTLDTSFQFLCIYPSLSICFHTVNKHVWLYEFSYIRCHFPSFSRIFHFSSRTFYGPLCGPLNFTNSFICLHHFHKFRSHFAYHISHAVNISATLFAMTSQLFYNNPYLSFRSETFAFNLWILMCSSYFCIFFPLYCSIYSFIRISLFLSQIKQL